MKKQLLTLALMMSCFPLFAQGWYTLDDNPDMPNMGFNMPGLFGAEDEFGTMGISLAPSPGVGGGFFDSTIQTPSWTGPAWVAGIDYLDAMASNQAWSRKTDIQLVFSVDRVSQGVAGTAVNTQAGLRQQPGDLFISNKLFLAPAAMAGFLGPGPGYAGTLPSAGGGVFGNALSINQDFFGLVPAIPPAAMGPAYGPNKHDNIDAYDGFLQHAISSGDLYFCVPPAQAISAGVSAADLFYSPAPYVFTGAPWAAANTMGLDHFGDDSIDALFMWDYNAAGVLEPGIDLALFSLAPDSATLIWLQGMGIAADGATIFLTDFKGRFGIYAFSSDLGLINSDNVDALEIE